jgi:hypothetical protein
MFGGTLFFVGLAAFFFFVYGRRKVFKAVNSEAKRLGTSVKPALSEVERAVRASEARQR